MASLNNPTRPLTDASLKELFGGGPTATGRPVTEEGALKSAVVFACVRVLAEAVSSLPLFTYRRLDPTGKERAPAHPIYWLLHDEPNPWMSSSTMRATMVGHLCLWGNAFAEIMRDDSARVTGLFPLRPDRMQRPKLSASGDLIYRYYLPSGEPKDLSSLNVLHVRALSSDGLWGYSPVSLQREGIALNLTGEEFAGRFFGQGAQPGGILETKGQLSPEAADRLARSWNNRHQGLANAHRVAILEDGVTWKQVGMPLQDAQFLEQRKYTRNEIASWFRIPPHMIGDVERSTSWGSGIEQQTLGFVVYTLRPWLVNWEQELSRALLTGPERRIYFVEHQLDGLLRGDTAARQAFFTALLDRGVFSINDVREFENLNPVEDGDTRLVQANMVPLDMVGQQQDEPADEGGGDAQEQEEKGLVGTAEHRAEDDAESARYQLRQQYGPAIEAVFGAVVDREVSAIEANAPALLGQRSSEDVLAWLRTYHRETLAPYLNTQIRRVLASYSEAVQRGVLAELGIATLVDTLEPFLTRYIDDVVALYTGRSVGQIGAVMRKALAENVDLMTAIAVRLKEWTETRAAKIADIETVRAGEAAAHSTYQRAGVRKLKWRTGSGGRAGKHCPYCQRINGRTVGIEANFIEAGEDLQGDEGAKPLRSRRPKKNPPGHRGCTCYISPG